MLLRRAARIFLKPVVALRNGLSARILHLGKIVRNGVYYAYALFIVNTVYGADRVPRCLARRLVAYLIHNILGGRYCASGHFTRLHTVFLRRNSVQHYHKHRRVAQHSAYNAQQTVVAFPSCALSRSLRLLHALRASF